MNTIEKNKILFKNLLKDELVLIATNAGCKKTPAKKNEIELVVFESVNFENILEILNNLTKNTLINICINSNLQYSNKIKSDLINQIHKYYYNEIINNTEVKNSQSPTISINKIIKIIDELTFYDDVLQKGVNETYIRDSITRQLNDKIGNAHKEYKLGGYFNLSIDIDIADGKLGIEIKKWKSLSYNDEYSRAIGQAYIYSKQRYR